MARFSVTTVAIVLALSLQAALASPTPTIRDAPTKVRRDVLDDVVSLFPDSLQDAINNGIFPDFFTKIPQSKEDLTQVLQGAKGEHPVEVLNLPGYANFTDGRWNLHIHGWAYTRPYTSLSESRQNDIADLFITDVDTAQLPQNEQTNARNLTSYVLAYPAEGIDVTLDFSTEKNGQLVSSKMPTTDSRGEYDVWQTLPPGLPSGSGGGGPVEIVDIRTDVSDLGNSTGYLVPDKGITIVSDIDDILRVTKIWDPLEGLMNSFARDFVPWSTMPDVFNGWAENANAGSSNANMSYHFHYLTTTPQQGTRAYMSFIYSKYPMGSFDTRPLNFSNIASVVSPRDFLLRRIFETFPNRKFVLVGDTSNNDVMKEYPAMAKDYPNQLQCILVRNVSATEPSNITPYNTKPFEGVKVDKYMFFRTPDDIKDLNFNNGDCVNLNVPQNVTFEWQGGPGGSWQTWVQDKKKNAAGALQVGSWGALMSFTVASFFFML